MGSARSIQDPEIQTAIKAEGKTFHPSPEAWEDQVIYFLLCDRFSDNNETNYLANDGSKLTSGSTKPYDSQKDNGNAVHDAQSTQQWLDAGAKFVGGTLKGVTSKLGYLKRLGITAVWVGPVFKQVAKLETYHGYGVQDFLDIDPRFGTKQDLAELVKAAHGMGMFVILDIILNHSGNVFQYVDGGPVYDHGRVFPVAGYYDADRNPSLPFGTIDQIKYPHAFPDGAVWPMELQNTDSFTQEGQISSWDAAPEFLDGDFFDLKDIHLGADDPDKFVDTPALNALCNAYKYWIAYADIDGYRLDTVKHMGRGPTRYFAASIHEFATRIGKDNFMIVGEITGGESYQTMETTGLDAALGIGNIMQCLWKVPRGESDADSYFSLFRNAPYLQMGSHTWLRNRIFTMIDDHDQVWRGGDYKGRFCASSPGPQLVFAAVAMNLCTLGIPCIYYGTEQAFDGSGGNGSPGHSADQFIRESMFGGGFGPFRSRGVHCFEEEGDVYQKIAALVDVRKREMALRRGRQYLREISGDGLGFGNPTVEGERMLSVVAWSRILDTTEIICAINTDESNERTAWVTVDDGIQSDGKALTCIYPESNVLTVVRKKDRLAVLLTVRPGGFVMYK